MQPLLYLLLACAARGVVLGGEAASGEIALQLMTADPSQAVDNTPDLGYDELWGLQNDFYERWITPNNQKEAESINSTIFSDSVSRRA